MVLGSWAILPSRAVISLRVKEFKSLGVVMAGLHFAGFGRGE